MGPVRDAGRDILDGDSSMHVGFYIRDLIFIFAYLIICYDRVLP